MLCKCGCSIKASTKSGFVMGHWNRGRKHTEEHNLKISRKQKGITLEQRYGKEKASEKKMKISRGRRGIETTEETKNKISRALKGRLNVKAKGITKEQNPNLAKTEETRRKISRALMGRIISKEQLEKMRKPRSEKGRNNIKKACGRPEVIAKTHTSESNRKRSETLRGRLKPKRFVEDLKKRYKNPEYKEKWLKSIFGGLGLRPTKPEKVVQKILNNLFPEEWKYVGDGSILIGFKNPDFMNVNGQKKVIEMFGDYWHSKKVTGKTKKQEENQRIKHFAGYGYKTLIIWERELRDMKKVCNKITRFMRTST